MVKVDNPKYKFQVCENLQCIGRFRGDVAEVELPPFGRTILQKYGMFWPFWGVPPCGPDGGNNMSRDAAPPPPLKHSRSAYD